MASGRAGYINTDLLLGCDVLTQPTLTWDHSRQTLIWGNAPYPISHVKSRHRQLTKVQRIPHSVETTGAVNHYLRASENIVIPPYQSHLYPVTIDEAPGTTVILYPEVKTSHSCQPCMVVNDQRQIMCPIDHSSKARRTLKIGKYLGSYEPAKTMGNKVNTTLPIHNDLLPHADQPNEQGDRQARIKSLLKTLDWSHLQSEQQNELPRVITSHDSIFIFEKGKLGTIKGPPVHINISDPNPVRGPNYRYPEKAKEIISMLQDMDNKNVIEPSTVAWLSPIVLVSKPDGSKLQTNVPGLQGS